MGASNQNYRTRVFTRPALRDWGFPRGVDPELGGGLRPADEELDDDAGGGLQPSSSSIGLPREEEKRVPKKRSRLEPSSEETQESEKRKPSSEDL